MSKLDIDNLPDDAIVEEIIQSMDIEDITGFINELRHKILTDANYEQSERQARAGLLAARRLRSFRETSKKREPKNKIEGFNSLSDLLG